MNIAKLKDLKQKLLERNTHNYSSVEIELEYDDNGVASILFENLGPLACKIIPLIEFKFTSTLSDDIFQVIIAELIDNPSILLIMDESMASGLYFLMGIQENKNLNLSRPPFSTGLISKICIGQMKKKLLFLSLI